MKDNIREIIDKLFEIVQEIESASGGEALDMLYKLEQELSKQSGDSYILDYAKMKIKEYRKKSEEYTHHKDLCLLYKGRSFSLETLLTDYNIKAYERRLII